MSRRKVVICLMALLLAVLVAAPQASAIEGTSYSYTISVDGNWIRTQDTYMPGAILLRDAGLNQPEDLFLYGNTVYVADGGNSRVVAYDMDTKEVREYKAEGMVTPTGLCVDANRIYVADYDAKMVFVFDHEGKTVFNLGKPESALFGAKTSYAPRKVTVDFKGNIYVVSEGTYQGLIQYDKTGEFLGFYGSNKSKITFTEMLQDLFFTEEQKASLFNRIPNTMYNATTDKSSGILFSITQLDPQNTIKKHNLAGVNILSNAGNLVDEKNFVDIAVAENGVIYTVTETGLIYEYTPEGLLLSSFGGRSVSNERNGQFTVAVAIDVDSHNNVYVLDRERGFFQVFYPTDFTASTHAALASLEGGDYEMSKGLWQDLLEINGLSLVAHQEIANAYFQLGDYDQALAHYRIANSQAGYSEAFWEIRNNWLIHYLPVALIVLAGLAVLLIIVHELDKHKKVLAPARLGYRRLVEKNRWYDDIRYMKTVVRHPIDAFYYLKKGIHGSVLSATVLMALAYLVFVISTIFPGFTFSTVSSKDASLLTFSLLFLVPLGLFIVGNYMVSSINSGEGSLKNVYVMTGYALSPYILFTPISFVLSYVLTLNEGFLITLIQTLTIGYTAVTLYLGIKETHNYRIPETIKNILLTLFFLVMAIVVFAILYLLWGQLYEFFVGIGNEVKYRVGY